MLKKKISIIALVLASAIALTSAPVCAEPKLSSITTLPQTIVDLMEVEPQLQAFESGFDQFEVPLYKDDGITLAGYLYETTGSESSPHIILAPDKKTLLQFGLSPSMYSEVLDKYLTAVGRTRKELKALIYNGPGKYRVLFNNENKSHNFIQELEKRNANFVKDYSDVPRAEWSDVSFRSATRKVLSVPNIKQFYTSSNRLVGCGPVAGAQIVAFWSAWYPQLMQGQTHRSLVLELARLMGTHNGDKPNESFTSESGLTKGLVNYFHNRGLSRIWIETQAKPTYDYVTSWIQKDYALMVNLSSGTALGPNYSSSLHIAVFTGFDSSGPRIIFLNSCVEDANVSEHLGYGYDELRKSVIKTWLVR